MESMYFLIPISFFFALLAIGFYIWAVKGGQYDDLDIEGKRILFEEEPAPPKAPAVTSTPDTNPTSEAKP